MFVADLSERVRVTFEELDLHDVALPNLFRVLARLDVVDAAVLVKQSRHVAAVLIKLSRHVDAAEGNHDAALGLAQDAVDREPHNAEALCHLAGLLRKAGRHEEARARRREAEALTFTFACPAAQA